MNKLIILTIILITVQFIAPISAQTEQKPRLVVQDGHSSSVNSLTLSQDNKLLASISIDNTIRLWEIRTGKLLRTFRLSGRGPNKEFEVGYLQIAFSPNGKFLASGDYDNFVKVWNIENGEEVYRLEGHTTTVSCVAFSPDGKFLAS